MRRVLGWIWSDVENRYVRPPQEVATDEAGVTRDYGVVYGPDGMPYRCGEPGEDVLPEVERETYARMADEEPNSEAFYRGLHEHTWFDLD